MKANPLQKAVFAIYTGYRWLRVGLQALIRRDAYKQQEWHAMTLALQDALGNRWGRCPHQLG